MLCAVRQILIGSSDQEALDGAGACGTYQKEEKEIQDFGGES
jgi:hypothetical protein